MQTYLKFHGCKIGDSRKKIVNSATFDGYGIIRHELVTTEEFISSPRTTAFTFTHSGKLYYFLTNYKGAITDYFEMNTSIEKCNQGKNGCYYEITNQPL